MVYIICGICGLHAVTPTFAKTTLATQLQPITFMDSVHHLKCQIHDEFKTSVADALEICQSLANFPIIFHIQSIKVGL
jgi:hypothetical protein